MKEHHYEIQTNWTGNLGNGTKTYTGYSRNHEITATGKPVMPGSSDPNFRGDRSRYNPEELLVASLSACHMLWYLHLCSTNGIVVTHYRDAAHGIMAEAPDSSGQFTEVTLHPTVTITSDSDAEKAQTLHKEAHHLCFIANSVNFPVKNIPQILKAAS